jgi:monofunctional biosynthetic peptidoglycan transglycosylase
MFIVTRILKILLRIVIGLILLSALFVLLFRWVPVPITPLMIIRCIEQKQAGDKLTMKHDWVPISEISPKLQLAVICSEDQNYLAHYGFDWESIRKAMKKNDEGGKLRGGSTISQQTAKNVFLWPGRSYVRKGFEAYFTLLIELLWSKQRIMEVYLNSIEMGKGIYGAEAASRHWFSKAASKLTRDEACALAAILPNPLRYSANPPGPYVATRKAWISQQMSYWGDQLDYATYHDEPDKKPERRP